MKVKFSKRNYLLAFVLYIGFSAFGQKNEQYIAAEIKQLPQLLERGSFKEGCIYYLSDTLKTRILTFRGRQKMNFFLFCIVKTESDSIAYFTAKDIMGYKIGDDEYFSHNKEGNYFFIKKLHSGKVDLYERGEVPSDEMELYFLKHYRYVDFFVINPYVENIEDFNISGFSSIQSGNQNRQGSGIPTVQTKGINQKFKLFISKYFGDCERVRNLVNADFYTITDIPIIVEVYNKCFDNK